MDGRSGQREMHAIDAAGRGRVEVLALRPAPGGQAAAQPQGHDGADRGDFLAAHRRRADLDFRHAGFGQQAGDGQLVLPRKGHARGLLAVAERRVDQPNRLVSA